MKLHLFTITFKTRRGIHDLQTECLLVLMILCFTVLLRHTMIYGQRRLLECLQFRRRPEYSR